MYRPFFLYQGCLTPGDCCASASIITATIRWVKSDGVTPAANPPAKVYLLESAEAYWSGTDGEGRTVSGSASNGLGDACVARTDGRAGRWQFRIYSTGGIVFTAMPPDFRKTTA